MPRPAIRSTTPHSKPYGDDTSIERRFEISDPWVLKVQFWLNDTYQTHPQWHGVVANGQTGWPTMEALTRALQIELGIPELSETFGPTTLQKVADLGPTTSSWPVGVRKVLQAACYCKGYDAGGSDIDGVWSKIAPAIVEMQQDISLSLQGGNVTPKLFKSILTMDAYVLVDGGSADVRAIQRSLNLRYATTRADFAIVPTDGIYSRNTQQGMMYALQYELDIDGANGNFGPTTKQRIQDYALIGIGSSDSSKYFVHLFQAALRFNGYPTPYSGNFTADTAQTTRDFQRFAMLPVTGQGDFPTWASLLVSTGDTTRAAFAADMASTITPTRANALWNAGYRTVGRYLTNTEGVVDPLDKCIKSGELATIFNRGLSIFPIFQEGGFDLSYFSYEKGVRHGQRAHEAARGFGFKPGTTIYFAVDFDALEEEVYSHIIPYFQGVNDSIRANGRWYRVGIYGVRNICSIVSNRGLAELSFVSGMSWGFSGNLGYPLPQNWAFDQIWEYNLNVPAETPLPIDKVVQSGRDTAQTAVDAAAAAPGPASDPVTATIQYIEWVEALAYQYKSHTTIPDSANQLAMRYLRNRHPRYAQLDFAASGGALLSGFAEKVDLTIPSSYVPASFQTSAPRSEPEQIDWPHMFCSATIYDFEYLSAAGAGRAELPDFGSWGGDMTTLVDEYRADSRGLTPYEFARRSVRGLLPLSFGVGDFHGDGAAWLMVSHMKADASLRPSRALRRIIDSTASVPYQFAQARFSSVANAKAALTDAVADTTSDPAYQGARDLFIASKGMNITSVSLADRSEMARAVAEAYFS